jgi:hypothetical protein
MAGYSARQASYTTGDTITAAHSNDEFNQVLAAFNATTGHTHDGTAGEGGPVGSIRDADSLNKVLVDSTNNHLEFYIEVSSSSVQQFRVQDGAIVPITDNDIDLGTSSLEFKDLFIDGTANIDTLSLDGTAITATGTEINLIDGGATVGTTAVVDGDGIIHNDGGTMRVTSAATFKTYFQEGISTAYDDLSTGDAAVNIATSAGDITIDAQGSDTDIILKGTDGGADTTFLTIDGSAAGKATFNSDVVVGGDLTVTGDDIIMGTNTAGNLLIADGTNFNSVAVGSLSEISTVANDDVFLAVDTSGGGLKKIARSAVVSGLATSSAISNVVEDTTPQLGGDLDVNGNDIVSTSNGNISLLPNGSGVVHIDGNGSSGGVSISDGSIDIRTGTGSIAQMRFFCESSNAHAQTLKAQPHSASSSSTLTLPAATGTLIGTGDTGTLPLAAIDIDGGTDIGAAIVDADLFIIDDGAGGTNRKVTASRLKTYAQTGVSSAADDITAGDAAVNLTTTSGNITIDAQAGDSDIIFKGTDSSADITALTLDMSDAGTAVFNHDIKIADDGQIGSASAADAMIISSGGIVTFKDDILIKDGGTIGSASDADAISISSGGVVTFSQNPVFPDGSIPLADLDIDGGTDIGANLADADLFIVDDGAGGTNRKVAASRIATYVGASAGAFSIANLDIDGGTDIGEDLVDADLFIVDNGAGGTNRKVAASRIKTYIGGGTQWQSIKTSNYTASAGEGVFANTTSGAFTVTLPASPSLGDEVTIVDYAGTADANNITVGRNSSPIMGTAEDLTISIERAGITLVYVDSTQGWLLKDK